MLKMVVSDLDGTLINGQNVLSPEIFKMLEKLKEKNIFFAVASGRKVCELRNIFANYFDDIIVIACDGAYVCYKGEVLLAEGIDNDIVKQLTFASQKLKDNNGNVVKLILNSSDLSEREELYIKNNRLLSLVYNKFGIKEYVKFGVNKGTALKKVLNIFSIDVKDVVAFGDGENDIQMLKFVPESYAVYNADDNIKRIVKHHTNSVCDSVLKLVENL